MTHLKSSGNVTKEAFLQKLAAGDDKIEENINTMMGSITGTSAWWSQKRGDLFAMVEAFGPPTFFLTLSCAEYNWPDMREFLLLRNKHLNGVENMRIGNLISKDTMSAVEQFKRRFDAFWSEVILGGKADGGKGPLGSVEHYFWRLEYQARGAPHIHALLWIKDAPILAEDGKNAEEVKKFIDQHITAYLPDESDTDNAELRKKVLGYQQHRCGPSCQRMKFVKSAKGTGGRRIPFCRFGFPRKVSSATALSTVERSVKSRGAGKGEKYYHTERRYEEREINDYNPAILLGWDANMDIQYVAEDSYVVVNYITKYVTKCEGNSTQELWDGISEQTGKSLHSKLYQLGSRALKNREMGAYEAAFWLLGYPLTGTKLGDGIKYVSTLPKDSRRRRYKSMKDVEALPEGSTDLFCNNIIDTFYPNRPDTSEFNSMCLYDMAANWDHSYKKASRKKDALAPEAREDDLSFDFDSGESLPESLPGTVIEFAHGFLKRRKKPHVIKTNYCSVKHQDFEERFFHSLLMLFKPWRNESELMGPFDSYSEAFCAYEDELQSSAQRWLFGKNKLQKAEELRKIWEEEQIDESTDDILPASTDEGDEEYIALPSVQVSAEKVEKQRNCLNKDQIVVYDRILSFIKHQEDHGKGDNCSCPTEYRKPLRQIVSGVAGTGKSFVIKSICDALNLEYGCDQDKGTTSPSKPVVAVLAPTGLAAYNVNGVTCHRYFKLPVQHGTEIQYQQLSFDNLKRLRSLMKDVKLIIIDEFSMISNTMLHAINLTLNSVFGVAGELDDVEGKEPEEISFGGKNILLFGDLLQLPPVLSRFCFESLNRTQRKKMTGVPLETFPLWDQFKYSELEINMRQNDDLSYSTLLNGTRLGNLSNEDIEQFQTCLIPMPENCNDQKKLSHMTEYFEGLMSQNANTLALFAKTKEVEKFNEKMLERLGIETIEIEADDSHSGPSGLRRRLKKSGALRKASKKLKTSDTAGLEQTLRIGKGIIQKLHHVISVILARFHVYFGCPWYQK